MRNPQVAKWTIGKDTEGLLLFAQRLEECLHDYSLDSYKAPALNTHTRCLELIRVVVDVRSGVIMAKTLRPVVEELCDSIAGDLAAKSLIGAAAAKLTDPNWWTPDDPRQVATKAEYLRGHLWQRSYERQLRGLLLALVPEGKEKRDIQDLTLSLAVEWIRLRFSRDYIYYRTRAFFFGQRAISADTTAALTAFFACFEPQKRKYDVCVRATASLAALAPMLPDDFAVISDRPPTPRSKLSKESAFLSKPHQGVYVVVPEVEALDVRSARNQALRRLENLSALATYHVHRTPLAWDGDALVWDGNQPVVLKPSKLPIHKEEEGSVTQLPKRVESTLNAISASRLPRESWIRIRAALGLHGSAIASPDVAVQLTTLWSAIETLIPPSLDDARISIVSNTIVPLLAAHYPRKLFADLHKSLLSCARTEYRQVLNSVPSEHPDWLRCAMIVAIRSNESLRDRLYPALASNPLLRFRMYSLLRAFGSADHVLTTVEEHRRRIGWHVRRIYRSRNLLVHAGHSLPYREAVVENLHTYFHRIVNVMETRFSAPTPPTNIDAAFLAERIDFEAHLNRLRGADGVDCTDSNIVALLDGTAA